MAMDRRRGHSGYVPLRDAINQLFEGSVITPQALGGHGGAPATDMQVTDEDVVVEMAIPGANPDDINISVTGDTLTVSGEVAGRRRAEKSHQLIEEIWRGRFQRSFQLPIQVDVNKADASFDNGVLTLKLPKSEATRPRKIQVRGGSGSMSQSESSQAQRAQEAATSVPVEGGQPT